MGLYLAIVGAIVWVAYTGAQQMGYNWKWYQIPQYLYIFTDDGFQADEILHGLWATIVLSLHLLRWRPCLVLASHFCGCQG